MIFIIKIENVLLHIHQELARMIRCSEADSKRPCSPLRRDDQFSDAEKSEDSTERLYGILEGSCLLPFIKVILKLTRTLSCLVAINFDF